MLHTTFVFFRGNGLVLERLILLGIVSEQVENLIKMQAAPVRQAIIATSSRFTESDLCAVRLLFSLPFFAHRLSSAILTTHEFAHF